MRIFVIRSRKGTVISEKLFSQVGLDGHVEILAHVLMNAFYYSNGMRDDVEVYIVLDSAPDFPRTLKFSSGQGLSFPGFHEQALLEVLASVLKRGSSVGKNNSLIIESGIEIFGFGFDVLMKKLQEKYPIYLLDKKGKDIRSIEFEESAVFVLSDHLAMPKNSLKNLERKGAQKISLGKKMLFASQCVTLIHHELDRR